MSATHVPQHVDVGARTLTPLVGETRPAGTATPAAAGITASERGDGTDASTAAGSTSTSIVAEGGGSEAGPPTPSRLTHPHSLEELSLPISSTAASSSKQSPTASPTSRLPPKSKSKGKSRHSPKPSTSTSHSSSPSAPILVNSPPEMHLPTSLPGLSGGPRPHRSSRSSKTHSPTSSPDPNAFSFASILDSLSSDPGAAADIDAIARICGRSRLSLANEYGAHRDPVGPGSVRVVGEDAGEDAEAEALEAAGLGVGFHGMPGLETVEETPATSESERVLTSEGSPVIGGPEGLGEGNGRERWGLLGVWEGSAYAGRSGRSASSAASSIREGTARSVIGSARPMAGLSEVEFSERAELEMGRAHGGRESAAVNHLMRLASVG